MGVTSQLEEDPGALGSELAANGVVFVEGYLDPETCDDIKARVDEMVENDEIEEADESMSGSEKVAAGRTLLDRRGGTWDWDEGMLDIFNIDESIPATAEVKNDEFIHDVIYQASSTEYTTQNTNIYYNRSVTNTRGYHFDSYSEQYKAFVYLTDVPDESYGPYSYIEGSHNRSWFRRKAEGMINRARGTHQTNALWFDEDDIHTFTAPKGTLIISDQTGYHRGIPQEEGKERMLISESLTPR